MSRSSVDALVLPEVTSDTGPKKSSELDTTQAEELANAIEAVASASKGPDKTAEDLLNEVEVISGTAPNRSEVVSASASKGPDKTKTDLTKQNGESSGDASDEGKEGEGLIEEAVKSDVGPELISEKSGGQKYESSQNTSSSSEEKSPLLEILKMLDEVLTGGFFAKIAKLIQEAFNGDRKTWQSQSQGVYKVSKVKESSSVEEGLDSENTKPKEKSPEGNDLEVSEVPVSQDTPEEKSLEDRIKNAIEACKDDQEKLDKIKIILEGYAKDNEGNEIGELVKRCQEQIAGIEESKHELSHKEVGTVLPETKVYKEAIVDEIPKPSADALVDDIPKLIKSVVFDETEKNLDNNSSDSNQNHKGEQPESAAVSGGLNPAVVKELNEVVATINESNNEKPNLSTDTNQVATLKTGQDKIHGEKKIKGPIVREAVKAIENKKSGGGRS